MTLPRMLARKRRRDNRVRCQGHWAWVARHSCCVPGCRAGICDPAHIKIGVPLEECAGQGLKSGDNWVISLCRIHHREQEAAEAKFYLKYRIDGLALAEEFARRSPSLQRLLAKIRRIA